MQLHYALGFKPQTDLHYVVNENSIKPRDEFLDLNEIQKGKCMPYTYEGCVVKISDKIGYIGRDIEDDNDSGFTSCCKKSCK